MCRLCGFTVERDLGPHGGSPAEDHSCWAQLSWHCWCKDFLSFFLIWVERMAVRGLEGVSARSRCWCWSPIFVCCNPVCLQTLWKALFPWMWQESNRQWFLWRWLQASLSPSHVESSHGFFLCSTLLSLHLPQTLLYWLWDHLISTLKELTAVFTFYPEQEVTPKIFGEQSSSLLGCNTLLRSATAQPHVDLFLLSAGWSQLWPGEP